MKNCENLGIDRLPGLDLGLSRATHIIIADGRRIKVPTRRGPTLGTPTVDMYVIKHLGEKYGGLQAYEACHRARIYKGDCPNGPISLNVQERDIVGASRAEKIRKKKNPQSSS
ncbi:MAG: hypothetical protein M1268_01460 [Patescibacteria group bacterium]|nr:hypothetical protein [Patescibacteria group bacterium]